MHDLAREHNYTPHIRTRGEEITLNLRQPGWKARRWVVEACHWLYRNRALIRWSVVALLDEARAAADRAAVPLVMEA